MEELLNNIMSILNQSRPTLEEIPKSLRLTQVANRIKRFSSETYNQLLRAQNQGIDLVWNHPQLTPQEIIDALGEDAVKIFQYHGALTEYIVALATAEGITPDIKLPTNAVTIEGNTITVTEDPYVLQ